MFGRPDCCLRYFHIRFSLRASDVTGSSLDDVRREIGEHRTRAVSNERDLNSVRSEIETNRKESERITRQLSSDQKRIDSISESLSQINEKIRSLEEQKERQKDMIARQLVEAYKIGKNDYLKLVLSQKDPAATDRALEYYRYINEARVQAVRDIEKTEAELREALKKEIRREQGAAEAAGQAPLRHQKAQRDQGKEKGS